MYKRQLIRLDYPEAPEDFRMRFAMQRCTDDVRHNEMQLVVQMRRDQNSADALLHASQFEAAKSASGWASRKVHTLKDRDGTEMMSKNKEQRPNGWRHRMK